MSHVTYAVVEHDGGQAYKVGDVYSETFATREAAHAAATRAAREQRGARPGGPIKTRTVRAGGSRKRNGATTARTPRSRTDASGPGLEFTFLWEIALPSPSPATAV